MFKKKVADVRPPLEPELVEREYGAWGEVKTLFDDAKKAGVIFLDEGTYRFVLDNGAALTVFASPFTPSLSDWGFQYHPQEVHNFPVEDGTDVFITHGPPKGVMDLTNSRKRAGCPDLFAATARQRPRLHCFGHIHEAWGAKLVTWRDVASEVPSHFSDIDNDRSVLVQNLAGLRKSKYDDDASAKEKADKANTFLEDRCCRTSHCAGDDNPLEAGKQTLFVNAAIKSDDEDQAPQLPWLVDIELQLAPNNSKTEDLDVAAPRDLIIEILEVVSTGAPSFTIESDGTISFDAPQDFRVRVDLIQIGGGCIERIHVTEPFFEGSVASRLRAVTVVDRGSDGEVLDFAWLLSEVARAGQVLPELDDGELECVVGAGESSLSTLGRLVLVSLLGQHNYRGGFGLSG
ncbi:hypothetical protein QQZ08_006173 [Neonectria magnoliae]|uniref:Calcineurin-like phosphoesterase domain-containing protein n=1 Tax=Neonectria magnoliae TaxID=2732573 RepID=A0ABR1I2R6_9HYPO